jgi:hypothetical protein
MLKGALGETAPRDVTAAKDGDPSDKRPACRRSHDSTSIRPVIGRTGHELKLEKMPRGPGRRRSTGWSH